MYCICKSLLNGHDPTCSRAILAPIIPYLAEQGYKPYIHKFNNGSPPLESQTRWYKDIDMSALHGWSVTSCRDATRYLDFWKCVDGSYHVTKWSKLLKSNGKWTKYTYGRHTIIPAGKTQFDAAEFDAFKDYVENYCYTTLVNRQEDWEALIKNTCGQPAKQDPKPLKYELTAYLDETTKDGQEILEILRDSPLDYLVVPMSGIPEVARGVARYIGKSEVKMLVGELRAENKA